MKDHKVYITRQIPDEALEILRSTAVIRLWEGDVPVPRGVLQEELRHADGLFCLLTDPVDATLMEEAPKLRIISTMAVGFDNIDVDAATRRGIMVTNTPGVLTETTADLAFALILATARRVVEAADFLRAGEWETWRPMELTGQDVHGATLGIVGMGRIGMAVARRARGFNMRVLYHNRRRNPAAEAELGAQYRSLDDLLSEADIVSLHCPLTPETRRLLGARELALMKPGAILVNTSRGAVVDEAALVDSLRSGRLWAAGLDVFEVEPLPADSPLLRLDNVVLLPHIGSASIATRKKMAVIAAEDLLAGLEGRRPRHLLNPQVLAEGDGLSTEGLSVEQRFSEGLSTEGLSNEQRSAAGRSAERADEGRPRG